MQQPPRGLSLSASGNENAGLNLSVRSGAPAAGHQTSGPAPAGLFVGTPSNQPGARL